MFIASQRVVSMTECVLVGGKAEGQWISGVTFQFQCHSHCGLPPCVVCNNPSLFTERFFPCVSQDYVLKQMDMRHLVLKKYKRKKAELPFPRFHSEMNSILKMSEKFSEDYTEDSRGIRINGLF